MTSFVVSAIVAVSLEGAQLDMSDKGIFGFLRLDNAVISFLGNGIVCTFFGVYGYIWALKYFSSVFVMNLVLIEPVIAQVVGVFFGTDEWPGWMTWLGVVIVSGAVNIIYQGE